MSIKVPASSTPAAAAAPAQTQKAEQATPATQTQSTQGAALDGRAADIKSSLQDRFQKDGFEGIVRGGCFPPPPLGRHGETMDIKDRQTASNLQDTLSNPLNQAIAKFAPKDQTISRGLDGSYSGPNGEPLAQVKLKDGTTAYVDPNTNQYYLAGPQLGKLGMLGNVQASGPYDLPPEAQFSNSHFSEADVKAVQRHAASGSVFDFPKFPIDPIPFPRLPMDPIMLTAADLKDGGQ